MSIITLTVFKFDVMNYLRISEVYIHFDSIWYMDMLIIITMLAQLEVLL